jgi:serine protease Do
VYRQGGDRGGESPDVKRIWDALGLRLAELSRNDPRLSAMRFYGGLQIIDIRPDSPADRSGLRKDDIVIGLERYATPKLSNVIWILDHPRVDEPPPSKLSFKFLRDGKQDSGDLKLAPGKVSSVGSRSDARQVGRPPSLFTNFARLP